MTVTPKFVHHIRRSISYWSCILIIVLRILRINKGVSLFETRPGDAT